MPHDVIPLGVGLMLGIRHAFDADHLVAVTTLISQYKQPLKIGLIGLFWGLGHTLTLLITGLIVLLFKISIPTKLHLVFESVVGIILVLLGIKAMALDKNKLHAHPHVHGSQTHTHLHFERDLRHAHHASLVIGAIHGLAGSGILLLLVITTANSLVQGIYYILLFGIGSTLGMSGVSLFIGAPLVLSLRRFTNIERAVKLGAGIISVSYGVYIIGASRLFF